MSLKQNISNDLKEAMKTGNAFRRDVLRFLDSAIKNVEIEKKKRDTGLSDEEIIEIVARSVKQRRDSISQYEAGDRMDLAEKEKKEIEIISVYMPEQMGEDEVRKIVKEMIVTSGVTSKADVGKIMGAAMGKLKGKADGNLVRKIAEEELK